MLEHKFCQPEAGLTLTEGREISGYASLFGLHDQGGDVVVPGAYAKSLAALAAKGRRVRMLWQHDPTQPIGIWDEVREDKTGLWVKGRLLSDVEKGREAAALLEAGALDGLSIGYRTLRSEREGKGRRLLELELWEVSLVTFPMLSEARITAKSETCPEALSVELEGLAQLFNEARAGLVAHRAGQG
ncbi:HK97 family phage prohead protease [Xinfangfangia sp. D13-10-4-6]|uniref:HK97 family phage prohead protease n=1 Tax=Pseudogemmobacter hezensis TaxID=2737662 RepID=UPI0015538C52|nr:HK97 family phage prohead protease [Pseudogemmobacter hezensis]NPD15362.1 HK97 family phage prohead protease [Pseudogemmobacter hezensis]